MILPEGFEELFKESLGSSAYERYSSAISADSTACVRINPSKFSREELLELWPDAWQVPWCSNGFYLPERPNFTLDPLFHAGAYYVQDASSMFLEGVFRQIAASCLDPNAGNPVVRSADSASSDSAIQHAGSDSAVDSFAGKSLRVLDLCAAPGGKSTHLLSLLGRDSLLISNEVISSRATILKENLAIWGSENAVVTSSDSEVFAAQLPEFFDIVLVDAPCSGEGMFRKMDSATGNAATENWSPDNVKLCAARQQRILASAVKCLKPGGWLIYSTCTYNHFENDDQLAFLKSGFGFEVQPISLFDKYFHSLNGIAASSSIENNTFPGINHTNDSAPAINSSCANTSIPALVKTTNGGYQFIPGLVRGEGQFCALLHLPQSPLASQLSPLGDGSTNPAPAIDGLSPFVHSGSELNSAVEKPSNRLSKSAGNVFGRDNASHNHRTMRNRQLTCESMNIPFEERTGSYEINCKHGKFGKRNTPHDIKLQKNCVRANLPEAVESLCAAMNQYGNIAVVKQQGELYKILPQNMAAEIDCVASALRVLGSGVALGCVKGNDFIPDAQLATSNVLAAELAFHSNISGRTDSYTSSLGSEASAMNTSAFKTVEVDRETALKFLAKQLNALEDAPLGILLICYRGKGLGFVKNIGRRVNNLLPNSRRILNL